MHTFSVLHPCFEIIVYSIGTARAILKVLFLGTITQNCEG
jgi:hypothetical protein